MTSLLPVAVYGLEVPSGDVIIPAVPDFPATFRITMAAIDPSAGPESDAPSNGVTVPRATLKMIRQPPMPDMDEDDSEGESDEEDYLNALLRGAGSEDDDEEEETSDDEQENGGPSDPSKSKRARKEKAIEQLKKALEEEEAMELDEGLPNGANGILKKADKGKAKATGDEDDLEDEDEDEDEEDLDIEEFVICTLDPTKSYQQPLDITIGEDEAVFFKVSGTHTIYLTGNYVVPANDDEGDDKMYDSDDDEDYDLSPDEEELDDEDESDELDGLDDPRITEVDPGEANVPKLMAEKESGKKGKNKRAAEESEPEPSSLDDIMAKSLKPAESAAGEQKLSKKQLKKLKNNAGQAVAADARKGEGGSKESPSTKGDKKVQFAKDLEQGPSGTSKDDKDGKDDKNDRDGKTKGTLGVKVVQGVTIDDKKSGSGPAAKKGNTVSMRYIGKLKSNGLQFDGESPASRFSVRHANRLTANKNGPPFSFKLGAGEVIKGWEIGVAGMSVGGERRMTIPAHLAYGKKKAGQIPANSDLIFDVKLLGVK